MFTFARGNKFFELSNHLGNVLVVVSDKKLAVDSDNDGIVNYYNADVVLANDEYPFGMQMPGRKYKLGDAKYRYGYNGQEYDKDYCDCENVFTAEFWEYDSRIGKRFNIDPILDIGVSPYAVNRNNPVFYKDPNGDCPWCIGFILGAAIELVEQTISNGIKNLANGDSFFTDWAHNIDVADILISGAQGALMGGVGGVLTPKEHLAKYLLTEVVGNAVKSSVDVDVNGNAKTIFNNTKSGEELNADLLSNMVGSVPGGFLAGTVTKPVITVVTKQTLKQAVVTTTKTVVKELPSAVVEGAKTGAYEGITTVAITPPKEKETKKAPPPKSNKSNSNQATVKPKKSASNNSKTKGFSSVLFGKYYTFANKITVNGKLVNNPYYKKKP